MKKFDYEVPKIDIILLNADDVLSESPGSGIPPAIPDPEAGEWV